MFGESGAAFVAAASCGRLAPLITVLDPMNRVTTNKKVQRYLAFLHFASASDVFRAVGILGDTLVMGDRVVCQRGYRAI